MKKIVIVFLAILISTLPLVYANTGAKNTNKAYNKALTRIDSIADQEEEKIYKLIEKLQSVIDEKEFSDETESFLLLLLKYLKDKAQFIEQNKEKNKLQQEEKLLKEKKQPKEMIILERKENKQAHIDTQSIGSHSPSSKSSNSCGDQYLHVGPRGGCYYINSNGNKTYVDRSCC